ncbi:HI0074 family nucleotidyltransferase substrate-binding subunit [Persephonella sp. KM09-Lau-8]|uniref:HI0074 family nucleotidyltransferase substrate-binding subunit n=1 Tax=Persephonella sp. KM09-Lau-8 TaxID=1158345 RepID=UPI0004966789|nr:HI0074 family nucleotidyltransferase substrate-binding subunit [Persephonella sp. KM09-Lau-8]
MSLEDRLSEFKKCLKKFEEVLSLEKNDVVRDSAIKRFELCFELSWKTLKDFLEKEGILCRSPRSCLKEAFSMGLIQNEDEWLSILEDRNLSVHTYDEALAEELYDRLLNHLKAMKDLAKAIENFK